MSWLNKLASFAIVAILVGVVFSTGIGYARTYDDFGSPAIHVVPNAHAYAHIPANKIVFPMPSPVVSPVTSAQLVEGYTDKGTYNKGDTASGIVVLKNTGTTVINNVTVEVTAYKLMPVVGYVQIGSKSVTLNSLAIPPGVVKKLDKKVKIPGKYKGIVAAGDYKVDVKLSTGGVQIGSFTSYITVK